MLRYSFVILVFLSALTAHADPVVIAHRGASGYLPEHTLAAYAVGFAMGADFIEPDLVLTKDKRFICLHDIHLEATTNVEQVFPDRHREDGKWYAADFTLAEIKTLEAQERIAGRFPQDRSPLTVPTFEEMVELVQGLNQSMGKSIGIYPELKMPAWHEQEGLPMEAALWEVLQRYGYSGADAPAIVQSFELDSLKKLREVGCDLRLTLCMGGAPTPEATPEGLAELKKVIDGIGPSKTLIERAPNLVAAAQATGLYVHAYTLRADDLPKKYPNSESEFRAFFYQYGVDGVWTDHPDIGVAVRDAGE